MRGEERVRREGDRVRREGDRVRREGEEEAEREGPVRGQYMWDRFTCKREGVSEYITICIFWLLLKFLKFFVPNFYIDALVCFLYC